MKAMSAQTAALLLFEPTSNRLIMSASAGWAVEHLEDQVSSLDPSTFAATVAATTQPTMVDDAEAPGMVVSDALRESGIHSLLGVRLARRHSLRGVMYIGVSERRRFSASEVRLMEALGDALTLHLDHAHLCAVLRARGDHAIAEAGLRETQFSVLLRDLAAPLADAGSAAHALSGAGGTAAGALVSKVVRQVELAQEMVAALADADAIRQGRRLRLHVGRCDLSALARDTVKELRHELGDRFIVEADASVCGMWSAVQLRRALWNLATNAVRFGDPDSPVLVAVRRGPEAAQLVVENQGPSIPAEAQAELFKPFSAPHSGRGHPPGRGLGLTLVWGCAEAHGGRVEVTSSPAQGTTFTLAIPYDARPYAD